MSLEIRRRIIDGTLNIFKNIPVSALSISGTPSGTTFLRDDGTWATPGITRSVISVTSSVTLGATALTDYVALIGSGGTATLPTAVSNSNLYTLKNIDTVNHTVGTTSSQTIDGSTAVLTPNTSIDVISDGGNWRVI